MAKEVATDVIVVSPPTVTVFGPEPGEASAPPMNLVSIIDQRDLREELTGGSPCGCRIEITVRLKRGSLHQE